MKKKFIPLTICIICLITNISGCFNSSKKDDDQRLDPTGIEYIDKRSNIRSPSILFNGTTPFLIQDEQERYHLAFMYDEFMHTEQKSIFISSTNDLNSWSEPILVTTGEKWLHGFIQGLKDEFIIIYLKQSSDRKYDIFSIISNNLVDWSDPIYITSIEGHTGLEIFRWKDEKVILISEAGIFEMKESTKWDLINDEGIYGWFSVIRVDDENYGLINGGGLENKYYLSKDGDNWVSHNINYPTHVPYALTLMNGSFVLLETIGNLTRYNVELTRSPPVFYTEHNIVITLSNDLSKWITPRILLAFQPYFTQIVERDYLIIEENEGEFVLIYENSFDYLYETQYQLEMIRFTPDDIF